MEHQMPNQEQIKSRSSAEPERTLTDNRTEKSLQDAADTVALPPDRTSFAAPAFRVSASDSIQREVVDRVAPHEVPQADVQTQDKHISSGLSIRSNLRAKLIQRAITTSGGRWSTAKYKGVRTPGDLAGVDIKLVFKPNATVDATKIGLTQVIKAVVNGSPSFTDDTKKNRSISASDARAIDATGRTDQGFSIDQFEDFHNPMYPTLKGASTEALGDTPTGADWGHYGYRYKKNNRLKYERATLIDTPRRGGVGPNSYQIFETTALALDGKQKGSYYGSVRWGWEVDGAGKFSKVPLQVVSQGVPSSTFMKAAELWNASKTSEGNDTIDLPLVNVFTVTAAGGVTLNDGLTGPYRYETLAAGTRVRITDGSHIMGPHLPDDQFAGKAEVQVVDGALTGTIGWVDYSSITDER